MYLSEAWLPPGYLVEIFLMHKNSKNAEVNAEVNIACV